jgi:hypothetical protein
MANLNDLYDAFQNNTFENVRRKIQVALLIKAQSTLVDGNAPVERKAWARAALTNVESQSYLILNYLIALNNGQTVNGLSNDTDNTVKTNVNAAIDALYPAT